MKQRLLFLMLILLLAGLLTFLMQDFARRAIATPLLVIYWVGRLAFESIPQVIIWWLFLFIAVLIAGGSLARYRQSRPDAHKAKKSEQGRIEAWAKLLRDAEQESYYKWRLAQHLQVLIMATFAHDERVFPREIQQRLAEKSLDLPPEIEAYLQASRTSFSHLLSPRSLFRPAARSTPLDLKPEQIIQFLEEKVDSNRN